MKDNRVKNIIVFGFVIAILAIISIGMFPNRSFAQDITCSSLVGTAYVDIDKDNQYGLRDIPLTNKEVKVTTKLKFRESQTTKTDSQGNFVFPNMQQNVSYEVIVNAGKGYKPKSMSKKIPSISCEILYFPFQLAK